MGQRAPAMQCGVPDSSCQFGIKGECRLTLLLPSPQPDLRQISSVLKVNQTILANLLLI